MKKVIYMIFLLTGILGTSLAMTGCSNPAKEENVTLTEEVSRVNQANQELKEEIQQLQQNNQALDEEIAKLDPSRAEEEEEENALAKEESIFNVYGANSNTYEREIISEVTIPSDLTLEEKLEILAKDLSKAQFGNLGIEVTKIEDEDGKKIATVNLTEDPSQEKASWETGYFQGSTGSSVTKTSLEETFLQREYEDEWIDGVKFLYNNEKSELGHAEFLGEIIYRQKASQTE